MFELELWTEIRRSGNQYMAPNKKRENMKKLIVLLIAILLTLPVIVSAQEFRKYTGSMLYQGIDDFLNMTGSDAEVERLMEAMQALGYVSGSWETGLLFSINNKDSAGRLYCPPMDDVVPNSQLLMIVHKFLQSVPEHLHKGAGPLTVMAFRGAFPCPK